MGPDEGDGGLALDEGTLRKDAFLNRFYESFWQKAYPDRGTETRSDAEGSALYAQAPNSFVSEYAATGPLEDFAESFSSFVIGAKKEGDSIAARKILFFYGYPELVALRNEMRKGLASLK
jgi:hypothetical protein